MQPAETRYPIREQELLAIVLALKQWFHLLRGPQQVQLHTDHESLRYLKTCPRPLTARQAHWSQFLKDYNLTLWYVPGLENPAADACSRLTSQQLMDIENATRTRAFVIPLVQNWASPEGEPVDEYLHVLEDSFSHDEVWPQPYDHLYVSLRSGRSVGKEPDADELAEPAPQFDTEPAVRRRNWSRCHQMRRLSSRRTGDGSQYHRTRSRLRIHTNQTCISMMLATSRTCPPTPTTFPM